MLERGDDIASYEHETVLHPLTRKPAIVLKRKPNGDCHYLGPSGCSIHERAPAQCRDFDCRTYFTKFTRHQRRKLERLGGEKLKNVFAAGRKRLPASA